MTNFHPSKIQRLVFDLDSISVDFDKEAWENFRNFISILEERDFETVLISKSIDVNDWKTFTRLSVLQSSCEEAYKKNSSLLEPDVFWVSENLSLQKKLSNSTRNFAGSNSLTLKNGGFKYQSIYDILQIFHPSKVTARDLSKDLVKLKVNSEKVPLVVGIGGPEECGHSFFIGELVETLEDREMLVSNIDLSLVLGSEFFKNDTSSKSAGNSFWHANEIREWLIGDILKPYSMGEKVFIENPPSFIKEFELTNFPFFLTPEMILLIWGTTIFLPELERFFDLKILLELSDKTATARMFGLDERQNFDEAFLETYLENDGKYYSEYLKQNNVITKMDYRIDFNNFYAFRFKEED